MTELDVLIEKINGDIAAREQTLRGGNMTDLAEYKYVCGQILGLEYARDHANSLKRKMETDE